MSDTGKHDTHNDKLGLMVAFGLFLTAYLGWSAGWDAALHHYRSMAFGLLLMTFAGLYTGLVVRQMVDRERRKAGRIARDIKIEMEKLKESMSEAMDDAIDALKDLRKDTHAELMEAGVHEAINQVTGGDRPPKQEEVQAIQDKFHELVSDHYLKLEILPGGMSVEVSEEPFTTTTTTTETTMEPVKSKSQMRREAVQKTATKKG